MKNASFDSNDIKKCCEKKLVITFRKSRSNEFNGWFLLDGKKTARISVPKGRKFIPKGTYKSMANQLRLTVQEFDEFLECVINLDLYKKIIVNRPLNFRG